jgi:serine/threonine protein kinase
MSEHLARGTVLDDRFEVISFLGAGSFGEVYSARQLIFGRPFRQVALKLFAAGKVTPANVDEVLSDAITLIGLQEENPSPEVSRHLVQVYDMGVLKTPQPRAFMSMKLVRGKRTLQTLVNAYEKGGMPVAASLRNLRQVLVPLAWMHTLELPIVHGDLKPDNVLVTEDSVAVLTDFGLAARMPLGALGGAIAYQAPEKLLGGEFGEASGVASDVYSIGVIWYEMLTGHHPFAKVGLEAEAAGDDTAYRRAHYASRRWPIRPLEPGEDPSFAQRVAPATEFNEELRGHPQLVSLLESCLAFEQSRRCPNAAVLLAQVDQYIGTGKIDASLIITARDKEAAVDRAVDFAPPPKTVETQIQDAEAFLRQGQGQQALAAVESALRAEPAHLAAMLMKVRVLASLNKTAEAREVWAKARQAAPRDPAVFEAEAAIYEAEGRTASANNARLSAEKMRREPAGRRRY